MVYFFRTTLAAYLAFIFQYFNIVQAWSSLASRTGEGTLWSLGNNHSMSAANFIKTDKYQRSVNEMSDVHWTFSA